MTDAIWLVRSPEGRVIGASAVSAINAVNDSPLLPFPSSTHAGLMRAITDGVTNAEFHGYTLNREALAPSLPEGQRSREEVLREFGANPLASYKELEAASNAMADRIRELEASVPTGHTGSDAAPPSGETPASSRIDDAQAVASAEAFHVAEYIEDEMRERDWSRDELALRMMSPDKLDPLDHEAWGVTRLALDLLLDVRDSGVVLGEQADALGRAFGTSAVLWRNLHNAWRGHPTTATTTHPPERPDQGRRGAESRVAAVVSAEMVEAAAKAYYEYKSEWAWSSPSESYRNIIRDEMRLALTAALRTTQGSASTEGGLTAAREGA